MGNLAQLDVALNVRRLELDFSVLWYEYVNCWRKYDQNEERRLTEKRLGNRTSQALAAGSDEAPLGQTLHEPVSTMVQGLGFRVHGSGLRVQGSGFSPQASEIRV